MLFSSRPTARHRMVRVSLSPMVMTKSQQTTPTAGPVTRTTVRLREGHVFESGPEGRGHIVDADAKIAPGPVETLLGALLACSGVDVVDILAKRRTPVSVFSASAVAHRRAEHP